jgi:hypothetical protein
VNSIFQRSNPAIEKLFAAAGSPKKVMCIRVLVLPRAMNDVTRQQIEIPAHPCRNSLRYSWRKWSSSRNKDCTVKFPKETRDLVQWGVSSGMLAPQS